MLLKKKKTPVNKPGLPEDLAQAAYADEAPDVPASERVSVLPPQLSSYLLRSGIAIAVLLVLQGIGALSLVFLATKPAPDLVQQDNGVMERVRPLDHRVDSVPDQVVQVLEDRLPRVYTWTGLLVNPDDPTGLTYIQDPGVAVTTANGENVLIPTTLYNEQFFFDEPIREEMMKRIAQIIKDGGVDKQIFSNDPAHPSLATVYRFILRGKIQYPQEISTGRWKVRVVADIVKFSPTDTLGVKEERIAEFVQDVYVRKASSIPKLFANDQQKQDLVWYGRKDGFVTDAMLPPGSAPENPGVPRN